MSLTRVERERITDGQLKLQSVNNSLKHVDPAKVPDFAEIQECLENADKSFDKALREAGPSGRKV